MRSKRFIERGLQRSQAASSDHAAGLANVGGDKGGRRLGQEESWTVVQPQVRVSQAEGEASSPFTLGSCVSPERTCMAASQRSVWQTAAHREHGLK